MFEQEIGVIIFIFLAGLVLGVILTLLINKIRSGSASPVQVRREMEDYQGKVEAHFDETSEKFKQMATQYQDLYKHLSVGATTLCRPENISPGLVADKDPLNSSLSIDKKPVSDSSNKKDSVDESAAKQDAETDSKIKADLAKLKAEKLNAKQDVSAEKDSKPAEPENSKSA